MEQCEEQTGAMIMTTQSSLNSENSLKHERGRMSLLRPLFKTALFFYINLFILFLAALGLCCCARAFLSLRRAGATL